VDAEQLKTYRAIARVLFQNLFGIKLSGPPLGATGAFLENWAELENRLKTAALKYISKPHHRPPDSLVQILVQNAVVDDEFERKFNELRTIRNTLAHGSSLGGMDAGYIMQALLKLVNTLPPWRKEEGRKLMQSDK